MRFLSWLVTTALALAAAAWIVDGIRFSGPREGLEEIQEKIVPLLLVALILGVVTSFVKTVLTILPTREGSAGGRGRVVTMTGSCDGVEGLRPQCPRRGAVEPVLRGRPGSRSGTVQGHP